MNPAAGKPLGSASRADNGRHGVSKGARVRPPGWAVAWGSAWILLVSPLASPEARAQAASPVEISVQVDGEAVTVDASFTVAARREVLWAVVTDFEHMTRFVSNLTESAVEKKSEHLWHVTQKGKASFGPLEFPFENVRELTLTPPEKVHSKLLRGNLKSLVGITVLTEAEQGTRFTYHGESVSGFWIPPIIGRRFIEAETREQFNEVRAEALRRQGAGH